MRKHALPWHLSFAVVFVLVSSLVAMTSALHLAPIKSGHAAAAQSSRRSFLHKTFVATCTCATFVPEHSARAADKIVQVSARDDDTAAIEAKSAFINVAKSYVSDSDPSPLDEIDWAISKKRLTTIDQMADAINDGLVENSWFVTGRGRPELFSDSFNFSDPQVSLTGYERYCRSVRKLFDQDTAKCELVCCSATGPDTITVLWRNSGVVNLGSAQIDLKPYLVTTTLRTDPSDGNLVVSQVDEFESDPVGLLLYQIPFLRQLAGKPAPNVGELKRQCNFYTCEMKKNI